MCEKLSISDLTRNLAEVDADIAFVKNELIRAGETGSPFSMRWEYARETRSCNLRSKHADEFRALKRQVAETFLTMLQTQRTAVLKDLKTALKGVK